MDGYSKIKFIGRTNSRSMDFTDLLTFSKTTKPNSSSSPNPKSKTQESEEGTQIKSQYVNGKGSIGSTTQDSSSSEQEEEGSERFPVRLSRNSSVSSAYALQSAVKRAFSMRRSSSVSERYCRIHDQSVTLESPFDDEEVDTMETTGSVKRKKSHNRVKILKACKKLLGL